MVAPQSVMFDRWILVTLARDGGAGLPAVIFITEAAEHTPPPVDALMTLFSLTWSEARVLEQIVSGKNRREAAAVLGVADSTVKTHLDNIYAKTGTSDQLGLCRLAAKLSGQLSDTTELKLYVLRVSPARRAFTIDNCRTVLSNRHRPCCLQSDGVA